MCVSGLPSPAGDRGLLFLPSAFQDWAAAALSEFRTSLITVATDSSHAGMVKPKTSPRRLQLSRELYGRRAGVGYSLDATGISRASFNSGRAAAASRRNSL